VRVLLDTQVLIWLATGSETHLSARALEAFASADELFFSIASYWELCLKRTLKKMDWNPQVAEAFEHGLHENGIASVPILRAHCEALTRLPFRHRDPFDRMLIAQALVEEMTILSPDKEMRRYDVKVVW
jgi:PIN domain nuclease of toxin-antitoxin system